MVCALFPGGRLWLRWLGSRYSSAVRGWRQLSPLEIVPGLVLLNIMLQTFDGFATYYGIALGVQEGNPLMHAAMLEWGVAEALLGTKGAACLTLPFFLLLRHRRLSMWALALLAGCYLTLSFVPWLTIFLAEAHVFLG